MKKLIPPIGSSPFPMRKRSFDAAWGSRAAWAAILGVCIAASAAFTAAVVFLMSPRQVRFFNVRAANLSDLRSAAFPGELSLTGNAPLLFFGEKDVVLGTVASVIAPKRTVGGAARDTSGASPRGVVVAPRVGWVKALEANPETRRVLGSHLPSAAFVVGFDGRRGEEGDLALAREAAGFAARLNAGKPPTLVFARVPGTE